MCSRMSVVLSVNNSIVSELTVVHLWLVTKNVCRLASLLLTCLSCVRRQTITLFVSRDAWPLASMYMNRMFAFFLATKLN